MSDLTDRDAAPAAAEGAEDAWEAAYRAWLVGRYGDRVITTNPQATFYGEMRHAFAAGVAWQAARPTPRVGGLTLCQEDSEYGGRQLDDEWDDEPDDANIDAARPAPAAAPRKGDTLLAELIARGEAMKEAFFTGDDTREAIACMEWDDAAAAALAD